MRPVLILALISSGALALLSLLGPPYVYSDQALQLAGVQSWQRGETRLPVRIVAADPADLTRDRAGWNVWNPPGFPGAVAALARLGLSFGAAIHLLAGGCFIAGCTGWSLWGLRFDLPRWLQLALPFLLAGIRYGNDNLVHFHAEAFLFAATPWLLLAACRPAPLSHAGAAGLGLALGLVYFFKYSGLFVALGVLALLARRQPRRIFPVAIGAVLPVFLLSAANRNAAGTENLVTASWHPHFPAAGLLHLAGAIPLTLADAGQVLEGLLLNPARGAFHHPLVVPLFGLPGLLYLIWTQRRKTAWSEMEKSTLVFAAVNLAAMLVVWTLCTGVGYERRYLAPASLALLPLILGVARDEFRRALPQVRILAGVFILVYVALPVVYGYATLAAKLAASIPYRPAASGLWNPLLTGRDGADVDRWLASRLTDPAHQVWYLPEPILALDLPGRRIFGHPTWAAGPLGESPYRTPRPLEILALAPVGASAVPAYLARIFPQSGPWTCVPVPQARYVLWTATLRP